LPISDAQLSPSFLGGCEYAAGLCPRDRRPTVVQFEWDNGLIKFEGVFRGVVGAIEKIGLVVQGQRDHPAHRVLGFLRPFVADYLSAGRGRGWLANSLTAAKHAIASTPTTQNGFQAQGP
jgi:hypothetical protein